MKSLSSTRSVILKLVLVKYLLRELSFGNTMSKALKTVWVNMIQLFESDIWSESQILRVLHYHNHLSRFFPDLYFKLGPILSFTSASSSVFFGRSCEGPYFIFPCRYDYVALYSLHVQCHKTAAFFFSLPIFRDKLFLHNISAI